MAIAGFREQAPQGRIGAILSRPALRYPIVLTGSFVLVLLAVLLYYLTGDRYVAKTAIVIEPEAWIVMAGQGQVTKQGLEIVRSSPQGTAFVIRPRINIRAVDYAVVEWRIDGLRDSEARFVWAIRNQAPNNEGIVLEPDPPGEGRIDLQANRAWSGFVQGIGLSLRGPLQQPLVIHRVTLKAAQAPALGALFRRLWEEWTFFEGWSQRSINFIATTPLNPLLPPVPAGAAWMALALLLNTCWMLCRRQRVTWVACGVIVLVGWMLLDVRWQWALLRQMAITRTQFAGKTWLEKRQSAEDGSLFQEINAAREKLPAEPVRLFLITDMGEGNRYSRGRARYHLLPHNVWSGGQIPTNGVHPGDYVLLLRPFAGIEYDPAAGALRQRTRELPALPIYSSRSLGLFRVDGPWR